MVKDQLVVHKSITVMFDYGGVLTPKDPDYSPEVLSAADRLKVEPSRILEMFWMGLGEDSGPAAKWMNGSGSVDAVVKNRREHQKRLDLRLNEEREIFATIRRPVHKDMVDFVYELKQQGVDCVLVSNQPREFVPVLREKIDLDRLFSKSFISCEMGVQKPDRKFFQLVLDALGKPANRTIFVDDVLANIDSAMQLGISCVHVQDHYLAIKEIQHLITTLLNQPSSQINGHLNDFEVGLDEI